MTREGNENGARDAQEVNQKRLGDSVGRAEEGVQGESQLLAWTHSKDRQRKKKLGEDNGLASNVFNATYLVDSEMEIYSSTVRTGMRILRE